MKTDSVFKRAFNETLDVLSALGSEDLFPSEVVLSQSLGVSRTTVRKVLSELESQGLVVTSNRQRRLVRRPIAKPFPETETLSTSAHIERQFMEWTLRDNLGSGASFNELELARRFGVATSAIREFLNRFQHYGLIEKRPNAGWLFKGFTPEFALELFEIREMFELRSALAFGALPRQSPLWRQIELLEKEHTDLLADIAEKFHDFSDLDNRFHRLINSASPNRFIDDFYDIISLIFHYHYQWNKKDERSRNEVAVREHLRYIQALKSRSAARIEKACSAHLASAKQTLINATTQQEQVS
ncbi:GntR family transcriptional regulator [Roseibium salinum]|uniref:GntR family transcriptional regulator n=1 Tax=Roseibium salinum TaxID=1604349 RepID=A0ABT3QW70_9HYPH|nr:GntR family transcriptional regulator [Roseibium sp. DSM 29163]MCX2721167.1 GntR family transcriptional regulator [Roseibium sp. DSM 29163]